jgi:hypothetical protein
MDPLLRDAHSGPIVERDPEDPMFPGENCALITVDLSGPDDVIRRNFERWLARRRELGPQMRQRGYTDALTNEVVSSEVSQKILEWTKNLVLTCSDLMRWSDVTGERITNRVIAKLLYDDETNQGGTEERVRKVIRPQAEAVFADENLQVVRGQLGELASIRGSYELS